MAGLSSPHCAGFYSDRPDRYDTLLASIIRRDDPDAFREYVVRYPGDLYRYGAVQCCERISDPFQYAAEHGSTSILWTLLSDYRMEDLDKRYQSDGEYRLGEGRSLLDIACRRAHLETVKFLLESSEDAPDEVRLSDHSSRGATLLCAAHALADGYDERDPSPDAYVPHCEETMRLLLDAGAPASYVHEHWEPREDAHGHSLPRAPSDKVYLEHTILSLAIKRAKPELVQRIIDGGAEMHARTCYVYDSLFDYNPATSPKNVTPLHIGSRFLNVAGIKVLFQNRGSVTAEDMLSCQDSRGRLPLHWAMLNLEPPWRELWLKLPDDQIVARATATVTTLLEHSSPEVVNAQDGEGNTALHYALGFLVGPSDGVSRLLRDQLSRLLWGKGADTGLRAKNGRTALHSLALSFSGVTDLRLMALFLERGANVHDADADGNTPLHLAAGCRPKLGAVRLLLQHGAIANARNAAGLTPLDNAADMCFVELDGFEKDQDEVMQTLLDAIGDASLLDKPCVGGKTLREVRDENRARWTERARPKPPPRRGGHRGRGR